MASTRQGTERMLRSTLAVRITRLPLPLLCVATMSTSARRLAFARPWSGARPAATSEARVAARAALRDHLVTRYVGGLLTASDLAKQAYWHTEAGGVGLEDLAVHPDVAVRHAAEHIGLVLNRTFARPELNTLLVPAYGKKSCMREAYAVAMRMPSSIFDDEYADHTEPPGDDPLSDFLAMYEAHPVVAGFRRRGLHWSRLVPAYLYWDGVRYTTRDSIVAFSIADLRSGKTHLLFVVRKEDMCKCGCRGHCTMFPLMHALVTNIRDSVLANATLAILFTKGDWPAFCDVAGVRQWSHDLYPCYECDLPKASITDPSSLRNITLEGGSWAKYTARDHEENIARCSLDVLVDSLAMRSKITRSLRYRQQFLGRGLIHPIPELSLRVGDRLVPTELLTDVASFDTQVPPFRVRFWRMLPEDRVLFDSPLFLLPGITIETHGVDSLHCWALGPVCAFVSLSIWFLISTPLYAPHMAGCGPEDVVRVGLLRIKNKLWQHYKVKRNDPHWRKKGSEIWNLTQKMLGTRRNPMMSVKAAEARGLLDFCAKLLEDAVARLDRGNDYFLKAELLYACAKSAVRVDELLRNTGTYVVTFDAQQELLDSYIHHVTLFSRCGGRLRPKHHMMFHLIEQCDKIGAPAVRATYRDESLNGVIARIAQSCHRNHFGEAVHAKFAQLQALGGRAAMHMS